jgi:hypothetical protein
MRLRRKENKAVPAASPKGHHKKKTANDVFEEAGQNNFHKVVDLLKANKDIDPNHVDNKGNTVLMYAVEADWGIIDELLKLGCKIDHINNDYETVLSYAAQRKLENFSPLLEKFHEKFSSSVTISEKNNYLKIIGRTLERVIANACANLNNIVSSIESHFPDSLPFGLIWLAQNCDSQGIEYLLESYSELEKQQLIDRALWHAILESDINAGMFLLTLMEAKQIEKNLTFFALKYVNDNNDRLLYEEGINWVFRYNAAIVSKILFTEEGGCWKSRCEFNCKRVSITTPYYQSDVLV